MNPTFHFGDIYYPYDSLRHYFQYWQYDSAFHYVGTNVNTFDANGRVNGNGSYGGSGTPIVLYDMVYIVYNAHGDVASITKYRDKREVYTYDSSNNLIKHKHIIWDGLTDYWKPQSLVSYQYDSMNNLTSETHQDYYGSFNIYVDKSMTIYSYLNGRRISEVMKPYKGPHLAFEDSAKIDYTYDSSGNVTTKTYSFWNDTSWYYIIFPEFDENYDWIGYYQGRDSFSFDSLNRPVYRYHQHWNGTNWQNDTKWSYYFSGSLLTKLVYGGWFIYDGEPDSNYNSFDTTYFDYNINNLITKSTFRDHMFYGFGNDNTITRNYYYELAGPGTGIHTALDDKAYKIYPNPAFDELHVVMSKNTISHVRITDLAGKVVFETKSAFIAHEVSIPLSQLANGLYLLQIQSGGQTGIQKIVVQHH